MSNTPYRKIDYSKLRFSEKHVSSEQALKDVEPIKWNERIMSGSDKVIISTPKISKEK